MWCGVVVVSRQYYTLYSLMYQYTAANLYALLLCTLHYHVPNIAYLGPLYEEELLQVSKLHLLFVGI